MITGCSIWVLGGLLSVLTESTQHPCKYSQGIAGCTLRALPPKYGAASKEAFGGCRAMQEPCWAVGLVLGYDLRATAQYPLILCLA